MQTKSKSLRRGSRTYTVKMTLDGKRKPDDIVVEPSLTYRKAQASLSKIEAQAKKDGFTVSRDRMSVTYEHAEKGGNFVVYFVEDKRG